MSDIWKLDNYDIFERCQKHGVSIYRTYLDDRTIQDVSRAQLSLSRLLDFRTEIVFGGH
ncbi:hypothetical protein MHK_003401 [Candidatus Magnetomorum sp. HK-1]|nr:hypothetical protein MHK_003401 [Candidatus Magnetomorum sp. HK-1]